MRVYIAGPMRHHKLYNFPAFDKVAAQLGSAGHDPVSPADLDRHAGFDPYLLPHDHNWSTLPDDIKTSDIVERDIEALRTCQAIHMLPGWRQSTGARAEHAMAEWMGLEVMDNGATEAERRKRQPVASGVLDYFPDAIRALAHCSWVGNEQHNPGEPLHWSRHKSDDHADCMMRHFLERGTTDTDGIPHSVKVLWRAAAIAQLELEE